MAILKCKMCGGDIQIHSDQTYGTCDSCGSTMTLPKASDERAANLFNRANHFRRLNDFDKALSMYENILNEDSTNAEAHWGVVLARYGIEYVEDPKTHKRIPTCNRLQFSSILSDVDYLAALSNAEDWYTRSLYEQEALEISEIQKRILTVSNNVEPFDVFICYKEKTNGGSRTKDSVLAQDIYYQLTKLGYNVFFARITLEDKLGIEYEPYIFAALNSAKVMTVIGTKEEYLDSAWVKNEWSRFLALMKKDTSKLLIPCFKGISPYDLPDELSMLQSQDMSKIGFMQDLIRGIKKVLDDVDDDNEEQPSDGSNSYKSLLERGFICLEDSFFTKADSLFEQVLNINPKCARAYIGKLLVERKLCKEDDLLKVENSVENSPRFKRALMYADSEYKQKLMSMKDDICERLEEERKQAIYDSAIEYSQQASMHADSNQDLYIELMQKAIKYFKGVKGFKDSDERIKYLTSFVHEAKYQRATKLKKSKDIKSCEKAIAIFSEISEYKDSQYQIIECKRIINEIKYNKALEYKKEGTSASLKHAASIFGEISDFNNADVQRKQCEQLAKEAEKREQEQKRKAKKVRVVVFSIVTVAIAFIIILTAVIIPSRKYSNAVELAKQGDYDEAISVFADLNYGDSQTFKFDLKVMEMSGTTERPTLQDKQQLAKEMQTRVVQGFYHIAALKNDGTVLASGSNEHNQTDVEDWTDIIQISAGILATYGLRADGTVMVAASEYDETKDAEMWNDIIRISSGDKHIIGLKSDGTVIAAGDNNFGQCYISDWTNIENIFAIGETSIGLKQDGSIVIRGGSSYLSDWDNIENIQRDGFCTAALTSSGTVHYSSYAGDVDYSNAIKQWNNIVAISMDNSHMVGIRSDGTVVTVGDDYDGKYDGIQKWKNITAVYARDGLTIGIKDDGTTKSIGYKQVRLHDFDDSIALFPMGDELLGLKVDGSFVTTDDYYKDDIADWNLFDETSPNVTSPDSSLPEPSSTEESEDKTVNLLTPTLDIEEKLGYIEYSAPSSWNKVVSDDELTADYYPTEKDSDGYIRVKQVDYRIPLEDRDDQDAVLTHLKEIAKGFAEVSSDFEGSQEIIIDGESAVYVQCNQIINSVDYKICVVVFEVNGYVYAVASINKQKDEFREDIELPYIAFPLVTETIKKVPPDFLDDSETRTLLVEHAKTHEYQLIIDLASAYIEKGNIDENDSVYAIKAAAEEAKEPFKKCQLIEDELSHRTNLYGDVVRISNDTNFVPFIGNVRMYSFELMPVRVGFVKSDWVFFEKTSIKTNSSYINDSYSENKVVRDVIDENTIREYTTLILSYSDAVKILTAENPHIRFIGTDDKYHVHKLTESEIESFSNIYHVAKCKYIINERIEEWEEENE